MSGFDPPKKTGKDTAHSLVKGAIGAVPLAGDLMGALFDLAVKPSFEKRFQKWSESVSAALNDLHETKGIQIKDLQGNEEFISTLTQATRAIQATHLDEKREMLANAVKNSAMGSVNYDKQQLFIHVIEQLSPTHIYILREIQTWTEKNENFDFEELQDHLRQGLFQGNHGLMELFIKQLQDFHFLSHIQTKVKTKEKIIWTVKLSSIAREFLAFIS
jgi:hypothetical protein